MTPEAGAAEARTVVPGSERAPLPGATRVGEIDPNERGSVTVVLRPRQDPAGAAGTYASAVPAQRAYLDRAAFAAAYGATHGDVAAVERFALDHDLLVMQADVARRCVVLEGTLDALQRAFGARLALYARDGLDYRGRVGPLSVPATLAEIVTGVFGLDDRPQARAHFRYAAASAAAATARYTPLEIAAAYDFPSGLDGTGQTIALIELGGGYTASDLAAYFTDLRLPLPTVVSVGVDGGANSPTGDPRSADSEVLLDIEVAGAVAPGARIVVYFAPNTDRGFLDAITTAIHDAVNKPSIVSISWGSPELRWTAQALANFDAAFAAAAMLGVTVLCAAGDNGSDDGVGDGANHVDFPSSSPHVVACGGTRLLLSGAAIVDETVWNDGLAGGATGGGVSSTFARPAWQSAAGVPAGGRGVPDVAGDADPQTGYIVRVDGVTSVIGGTSAVAPLYAALLARINQRAGTPAGFVNALLYANPAAFHDILIGNNGAFSAAPGWDACTGLGSPDGARIAVALGAGERRVPLR
ncbi:MAG: S53 family peptidase [Vulcanimicrobiaceae bacterium]